MLDIETIKKCETKPLGSGVECAVHEISGTNMVVKTYDNPEENKFAGSLAQFAHLHGFGPAVYCVDTLCYYTEKVTPLDDIDMCINKKEIDKELEAKLAVFNDGFVNRCNRIYSDFHEGNVGRTDDGRWVIIDFGIIGWRFFIPALHIIRKVFPPNRLFGENNWSSNYSSNWFILEKHVYKQYTQEMKDIFK